ncbi:hypothetical protein [Nocardioides ungokensis]|uniref:hypothetical protein n=1 Tax=Nocardioides ungokensis TaxID=1643322 RepID=UPI0015DEBCCF|nr:hypothetical protein [Nocardioides ungokensis]
MIAAPTPAGAVEAIWHGKRPSGLLTRALSVQHHGALRTAHDALARPREGSIREPPRSVLPPWQTACMFQTLSTLFNVMGLAGNVAGGVADHVILERKIKREIEQLENGRRSWLLWTLVVSAVSILIFVVPALLSDYPSGNGGMVLFALLIPGLLSLKTISVWMTNGERIRALQKMLRN